MIHTACLSSLVAAQNGLLAGHNATTHWNWTQRAAQRFPEVNWETSRMICESGRIVTAGGFLATVDLALALVERTCGRKVAHELGHLILADSVRQHQSVYATTLVASHSEDRRFQRLERWLQTRLSNPTTVSEMAEVCLMSTRSFHRDFVEIYGVTPRKFIQLKRIEKVRQLLRRPETSLEDAMAKVGVSDVPAFRKIFRRELGVTPAEYRRRLRDTATSQ